MKKEQFMEQKLKDVSIKELAKAIQYKTKENSEESKTNEDVKVGDRVIITKDFKPGVELGSNNEGKKGTLVRFNKDISYKYRVKMDNSIELNCYAVEKIEETSEVPFKVGDVVKQVRYNDDDEQNPIAKITRIRRNIIYHIHKGNDIEYNCSYKDADGAINFVRTSEKFEEETDLDKIKQYITDNPIDQQYANIHIEDNYIKLTLPSANREWTFSVWDWVKKFVEEFPKSYPEYRHFFNNLTQHINIEFYKNKAE